MVGSSYDLTQRKRNGKGLCLADPIHMHTVMHSVDAIIEFPDASILCLRPSFRPGDGHRIQEAANLAQSTA